MDDLNFISSDGIQNSFKTLKRIIDACEKSDIFPISTTFGEPNLGKRSLISTISKKKDGKDKNLKNFLAYSDGKRSIFEISIILKENLETISRLSQKLFQNKLIKYLKK